MRRSCALAVFLPVFLPVLLATSVAEPAPAAGAGMLGSGGGRLIVGNPGNVEPAGEPGLVLMGGGPDVDEAFRWMIERSGGGDFVVLRASGGDAYNDYIASLGPVDSVETLVVRTRAAAEAAADTVKLAEAVFIAGGDQADYVRAWKGTALEDAIERVAAGSPVGGTSAGLAVLGDVVYSAENGSVYPREALRDPFNRYLTFDRGFLELPQMEGVITESHFFERNRMGRLVTFLARMRHGRWVRIPRGIAVDEGTALLVDGDGHAVAVGDGHVYLARITRKPKRCEPGRPLVARGIVVARMGTNADFDLGSWSGTGLQTWRVRAQAGRMGSSVGAVYGP